MGTGLLDFERAHVDELRERGYADAERAMLEVATTIAAAHGSRQATALAVEAVSRLLAEPQ